MDLTKLTHPEMVTLVEKSEDKDELRAVAAYLELSFSGNTGANTLKEKILAHLNDSNDSDDSDDTSDDTPSGSSDEVPDLEALLKSAGLDNGDDEEEIQIAQKPKTQGETLEELLEMDPAEIEDTVLRRKVVRARSLRLIRCRVRNLDPSDAQLEGAYITAYNKYTGKQTKYVPYSEEVNSAGWHLPQMILDHLETKTFNMRKEVRNRSNAFGIKTYKTIKVKKYAIEILPSLSRDELEELAKRQAAANSIDRN